MKPYNIGKPLNCWQLVGGALPGSNIRWRLALPIHERRGVAVDARRWLLGGSRKGIRTEYKQLGWRRTALSEFYGQGILSCWHTIDNNSKALLVIASSNPLDLLVRKSSLIEHSLKTCHQDDIKLTNQRFLGEGRRREAHKTRHCAKTTIRSNKAMVRKCRCRSRS